MERMRARLGQLMRQAERGALVFELESGEVVRYPPSAFMEAFAHGAKRAWEQRRFGYSSLEEHPLVTAIKCARDREKVAAEYGTLLILSKKGEESA